MGWLSLAIATIPLLIWIYLLTGRGLFWALKRHLPTSHGVAPKGKYIAVVIPARNEARFIGDTVASLIGQSYRGQIHIYVVDDASMDGTAQAALKAAQWAGRPEAVTVIEAQPLPTGWTGKMWAVHQGIASISRTPDFLLLTDADIRHEQESLAELVAIAAQGDYDLVSFMVRLKTESFAERALIPAFVFFFFLLYPPAWIANSKRKIAGAAGGCMLVRPETLRLAGGIAAIRGEVIDDCALAGIIKKAGGKLWLGLTETAESARGYGSFGEIERMIARTAFNQLNHSAVLLAGTIAGLVVTYLLPVALVFSGRLHYSALGLAAWLLMSAAYFPMVRFYEQNAAWALALPAIALFYAIATIDSACKYWSGAGGQWKGRSQDPGPTRPG
jgi:hopene-associated glycosyltransferase HpnB